MAKGKGRRNGGRNRGYYFRKGRGWYAKIDGAYVPLEYDNGDRMRDQNTPLADVKAAYFRLMAAPTDQIETTEVSVLQVCNAYLAMAEHTGAESTLTVRENTLFDFCFGLPSRFVTRKGKQPSKKPTKADYIHPGFGRMAVSDLKPLHIDKWLQAHPGWKGARRTKIQAVKRAFNYGVESGMIPANPIKGYKVAKQNARVTYLTPEQESALLREANPALAMAIKVCIRTGARPGCEFAGLTARHIQIQNGRMSWTFQADESKTKKLRTIRITDDEIIAIVRSQIEQYPTGPIFRNTADRPWTRQLLGEKFRKLKNKLISQHDIEFDDDACMYSCRHTYAKRTLQGYWTRRPTNIETLAQPMGNSPQICHDHYLQFCESYSAPLWDSA